MQCHHVLMHWLITWSKCSVSVFLWHIRWVPSFGWWLLKHLSSCKKWMFQRKSMWSPKLLIIFVSKYHICSSFSPGLLTFYSPVWHTCLDPVSQTNFRQLTSKHEINTEEEQEFPVLPHLHVKYMSFVSSLFLIVLQTFILSSNKSQ